MDLTQQYIALALGILALVSALVGLWRKWAGPKLRIMRKKAVAAVDALAGREAIVDSITGEVRVPALPGIGVRMAHQEQLSTVQAQQMEAMTAAITKLVAQQESVIALQKGQEDHEGRLKVLEAAQMERVINRVDSAQAWQAMEAAIKAKPDPELGE